MSSEADKFWNDVAGKLRKKKGFCPPTPEEAEAAFDDAPAVPLSEERIKSIVESATSRGEEVWTPEQESDEAADAVAGGKCQMFRNEGDATPETDKKEDDLKRKMLSDDDPEEDET